MIDDRLSSAACWCKQKSYQIIQPRWLRSWQQSKDLLPSLFV